MDYLREGYSAAGLLGGKTSSEQRAIGFVMTTFQKIMASSPRAIAQALRRRLVVLLVREQLALEGRRSRKKADSSGVAEEIMTRQDEALHVAESMLGARLEADVYVARVRRRLLARREEDVETTVWALEDDGSADDVVFAETNIPGEIEKVRELIRMVPTGRDRRFAALLQGVSELLRQNARERVVVFTQYRDTLDYVAEELAAVYGPERIATLKGGPLEEKLEAVERFWSESGAQFLISTSAGGEGINLQVARILFNYDLPWNPMAVEQRIGRIHRYGQEDTVQVYTLIARDTVEERIYDILQAKLREVAKAIGKTDPRTGEVAEDFERDVLGFIGGRPDYQELYRRAILDKNFKHTEAELARMVSEALKAREALAGLAQDLSTFNIESYRKLEGRYPLEEFGRWAREGVLRLGGAVLPDGPFWTLHTPESLLTSSRCAPKYERVTFDRSLATRTRRCELGGIGHPLMDSLLETLQSPAFPGDVAASGCSKVVAQYLVRSHPTKGTAVTRAFVIAFDLARGEAESVPRLPESGGPAQVVESSIELDKARGAIEVALEEAIQKWLPDPRERGGIETRLAGLIRV